ncbi:hypothetical protein P618_200316 [Holospora obtusa F1]|uniref:Uncharacterized protein n=1 Tax=Holospora obtusa F1 TaxID=1399147 RepID=W6THQ6_HOLOB|nr:hypothetical protein P618_200316 [Holospora obtusa F1]
MGIYDDSLFLCEDYEYWLRTESHSKIHPIMKCLYEYRRHSDSLSHQNEKKIIAKGIFIRTHQEAVLFFYVAKIFIIPLGSYICWLFCSVLLYSIDRKQSIL